MSLLYNMIDFSLILSLLSLAVSGYALYSVRLRHIKPIKPVERARLAAPKERAKLLTREDRREKIAAQASDPVYVDNLDKLRKNLRDGSGLIAPDPEFQMGQQPDWRRRNAR